MKKGTFLCDVRRDEVKREIAFLADTDELRRAGAMRGYTCAAPDCDRRAGREGGWCSQLCKVADHR